jgi:hypothetical protein
MGNKIKTEKWVEYAGVITAILGEALDNEDYDYYIDREVLMEENNLTHFIHALANVVPTYIHNALTNSNHNQLEFNHTANQLCFQFSNRHDVDKNSKKVLDSLKEVRAWYEENQKTIGDGEQTPICFSKALSVIQESDN